MFQFCENSMLKCNLRIQVVKCESRTENCCRHLVVVFHANVTINYLSCLLGCMILHFTKLTLKQLLMRARSLFDELSCIIVLYEYYFYNLFFSESY